MSKVNTSLHVSLKEYQVFRTQAKKAPVSTCFRNGSLTNMLNKAVPKRITNKDTFHGRACVNMSNSSKVNRRPKNAFRSDEGNHAERRRVYHWHKECSQTRRVASMSIRRSSNVANRQRKLLLARAHQRASSRCSKRYQVFGSQQSTCSRELGCIRILNGSR